jgi:integrase
MTCSRCSKEIDDDSLYCKYCGRKQVNERNTKQRGNGQGSVYQLPDKSWRAVSPSIYYKAEDGTLKRKVVTRKCKTKKEAVAALAELIAKPEAKKKRKTITFRELYDKWYPTHNAGKSTMGNYKAAIKYFSPVWFMPMSDIDVDDLQDCIDNCGRGKRTQENMRAVCGLVYKYGIPRQCVPDNLNLAQYLKVGGDSAAHRESFDAKQIEAIKKQIGKTAKAEYVYCLIYLGFRPSEFLSLTLDNYDAERQCFIGGSKTEAGTNRTVTISPKILPYIKQIAAERTEGVFFCANGGKAYSLQDFTESLFYPVLAAAGIDNPMVEISGGVKRHKFTPHSCRHTFATLLKNVNAADKDKLELIGHTSDEMLRYYQDVKVEDLRRITDII